MPSTLRARLCLLLPCLVLLILVLPRAVQAQTANPTKVEFTASADHNALLGDGRPVVEKYVLNVYQVGAQAPFHTVDLGKPTPDADNNIVADFSSTLPGWPLPGGTYESRVAATGPSGEGLSDVSNTFCFGTSCPTPPPACTSFTISPASANPAAAAGSQAVTIAGVPAGCAGGVWSAAGNGFWITVAPVSGTGPGSATVSWTANTSTSPRSGNATIAGNTFSVTQAGTPPPPTCTSFSISPTSASPGASAGTQLVTITGAPAGCAGGSWTASGNGSWLSVFPTSGTGPGGVTVSWTGNTSTSPRTSSATVAGIAFPVTQAGAPVPTCTSFSVSPTSASSDANAGSRQVAITGAPGGCTGGSWTATGNGSWLTVSPASGTGSGSATVSWTANASPSARLGYATIAGNSFPVNQSGVAPVACTSFTIAPAYANPAAAAGSQAVTLTGAPAGCTGGAWTATGVSPWLTVSPAIGNGPGTATVSWTANTATSPRTGTATLAGNPFPVTQAAATPPACTSFSISPTSASPSYGAGSQVVAISGAPAGCAGGSWSAAGNGSWLTVSPASGTGPGSATVSWTANPSTSPRSSSATIAGNLFAVTQAAAPPPACSSFSIAPTSASPSYTAGSQIVSITGAPAGCVGGSWSAAGNGSWLTVSPTSGTGPGAATVSWSANASLSSRTGYATIAGIGFPVTQAGTPPPSCTSFSITPTSANAGASAGSQEVTVIGAPSGCAGGSWSAAGNGSWLTVAPVSGSGPGPVTVSWTANASTSGRSSSVTIAGLTFAVSQAGAPPPVCTSFSIAPASVSPTSAAGAQAVALIGIPSGCAGGSWTAAGNGSWLTVAPSSGNGPGAVTVTWTQNTSTSPRSSNATVAGNTFPVTQAASAPQVCTSFSIDPASASPGPAAGSQVVAMSGAPAGCSGGAWIAIRDGSWLTVSPTSGTGPGSITVSWTANTSAAQRSGTATIGGNPFAVTQAGTPPPACTSFSVTPPSLSPAASAGSQVVTLTGAPAGCAGGSWTATGNGSWLTASPASGSGTGTVTLAWTANTSASARTANAAIAGNSVPVTQAGTQSATCTSFVLSPGWVNTPGVAGSIDVTMTGTPAGCSGGDWTASGKDPWVTVSPATGSGPGTVTVSWAANPTPAPRWSSATIAGVVFSVTQFGGVAQTCSSFTISPTSATPANTSGSVVVSISGAPAGCTGGAWTAAGNAAWVSVLPASSTGSGSVMLMWTANASTQARSATATIAGNPFPIQQAGVPPPTCTSFTLAPSSANPGPSAGSEVVTLTGSPSGCAGGSWTAAGNGSWLTVSPASGSGPGTVTVEWTANRSTSPRSASAAIAGAPFPVTQSTIFPACAVTPSPAALSFPTSGGTGLVTVGADPGCAWDVQTTASWITLGSAGSTGPGEFGYTVSANAGMGPRTATVTIGGVAHTVTQDSVCTYTLSATTRSFTDAGGQGSVSVATGPACTWQVTTSERWISVTTAGGTGVGTASFLVAVNTLSRSRTGTVTIGEATLTVLQEAWEGTSRPSLPVSRYSPATAEYILGFDPLPGEPTSSLSMPLSEASAAALTWGGTWSAVVSGDFNADESVDYVLYDKTTGAWARATATGGGDFTYESGAWPAGFDIVAADFDGDGRSDVLGYNPADGSLQQCSVTAAGGDSFTCSTSTWPAGSQVFAADFDDAAAADALLFDRTTGALTRATGGPVGLTLTGTSGTWPAGAWKVLPGDFDGNGRSGDFLLYDPATGQTMLQVDTGSGFAAGPTVTWSTGWQLFGGDFNGDGRTDVFLYDPLQGRHSLGLAAAPGQFNWKSGQAAPGCDLVVRDVNDDGLADAVFYDPATGTSSVAVSRLSTRGHDLRVRPGSWGIGWRLVR